MRSININRNSFDFIRFMLAFIVMLHHITVLIPGHLYPNLESFLKSQIAIRCFFVISGFLVAKSLENTPKLRTYFIKRIRRIVPAYTFVILFFAIGLSAISILSAQEYFTSMQFWQYLGANLVYQNYLQPCLPGVFDSNNVNCSVNGALWTIKIEEGFYLVLPIVVYLNKKIIPNKWLFYTIIYIISLIYFNYFNLQDQYRIAKQLPGAMAYFSCGIVAYYYFEKLLPYLPKLIVPAIIIYALEYVYLPIIIFRPICITIIILYIAYFTKFLNGFGKYGDFTYGTYIFHYPIIQVFVWFSLQDALDKWGVMLLIIAITLSFAIFSWGCIEIKFISQNFLKRIDALEQNS